MFLKTAGVQMYRDSGKNEIYIENIEESYKELIKAIRRGEHCILYLEFDKNGGYLNYILTGEKCNDIKTDEACEELIHKGYHIVFSTSWSSMKSEGEIWDYIHDCIFEIYDNDLKYYEEQ